MSDAKKATSKTRQTTTVKEDAPDHLLDAEAFKFGPTYPDPETGVLVELSEAPPDVVVSDAPPERSGPKKKKKPRKKAQAQRPQADDETPGEDAQEGAEKAAKTSCKDDLTPRPLERDEAPAPSGEEAKKTTTAPAHEATKEPPRGSYAWMWNQARPQESNAIRWTTIGLGVSAALILALPALYVWNLITPSKLGIGDLRAVMQEQEDQQEQQRKTWHEMLANAPVAHVWEPSMALPGGGASDGGESEVHAKPSTSAPIRSGRAPLQASAAVSLPAPELPPEPPSAFEELFGSATDYQKSTVVPSSQTAPTGSAQTARKADARGVEMRGRLKNQLASDPAGAPAIAVLERATKVGNITLPAGTEINGTVTGAGGEDTRILVTFTMARLPKTSETMSLQGVALDKQGRMGIPGKKQLTGEAAKSLGIEGAIRGLQHGAQSVGHAIGGATGAAISGVGDAAGNKAKRADRDEYVVISGRGTPLIIYVQNVEPTP